ncbi:MAG: DNA polymerase III subunit gamma/tau [Mycoplasma sp.]|nr:DNA polymerase III subunit gamma/tau [Mycoplasma sp.]
MSYKALYRKYRPNNFEEIKGQEHITTTLKNIIKEKKVSHAYLFSGPRGTGKTSAAKVFANILNCKDLTPDLKLCERCDYCQSIKNSQSLDVLEIDAASNNGVSEMRELRENVKYSPSSSKYKVYIIDEVHMLTKGAFNALLKTLEEPPSHVIFILATTEVHKIPVTIISRTQRFNFRRVSELELEKHLKNILDKENITYDNNSIITVSKLANGGMRDALSIVDQVSAYTNGKITFDAISQVFGIISTQNLINIINHASSKKVESLLNLSTSYIEGGADIQRMTMSLINILKDFIVYKSTNQPNLLKEISIEDIALLNISIFQAYFMLDVLVELLTQLSRTEYPKQTFELAMLKLIQSRENISNQDSEKIDNSLKVTPEEDTNKEVEAEDMDDLFTTQELSNIPTTDFLNENEVTTEQDIKIMEETLEKPIDLNAKKDDPKTSTQEILGDDPDEEPEDLLSLFSVDSEEPKSENIVKHSIAEIINLLIQTNPEYLIKSKRELSSVLSFSKDQRFAKYATLIDECKIISAGENFILISAINEEIIKNIVESYQDKDFKNLIKAVFGKYTRVFAITRTEFKNVKSRYTILAESNNLPEPIPVKPLEISDEEKTEAEKLGSDLFGDLFPL